MNPMYAQGTIVVNETWKENERESKWEKKEGVRGRTSMGEPQHAIGA